MDSEKFLNSWKYQNAFFAARGTTVVAAGNAFLLWLLSGAITIVLLNFAQWEQQQCDIVLINTLTTKHQ